MNVKSGLMTGLSLLIIGGLVTSCADTGASYRPVIDTFNTPANVVARQESDLAQCHELAETRSYADGQVATKAGAGAAIGSVVGLVAGGLRGAAAGAAVGGATGAGAGAADIHSRREQIVIKCMRTRGHNVVD